MTELPENVTTGVAYVPGESLLVEKSARPVLQPVMVLFEAVSAVGANGAKNAMPSSLSPVEVIRYE